MVRLTNCLCCFMNMIIVNVNAPIDLICTSTLHHLHTVKTKIEQLQKGKTSMASNNKDKKQC